MGEEETEMESQECFTGGLLYRVITTYGGGEIQIQENLARKSDS